MWIFDQGVSDFDGLRFVIARYGENIEWLPSLVKRFPGSRCTVYNKGSTDVPRDSSYDVRQLENVGRESHTYLHHVIQNYESTDDEVIVFLQAHPFDHLGTTMTLFEKVHGGVLKIVSGSSFENIGTRIIKIEDGVPLFHMTIKDDLEQTCVDLFGNKLPKSFEFSAGALFVTSRSTISNRPVDFYRKALDMVDSEINPIRGFCFERLWSLIFTH